jgi:fructose-1,6-bisphosphatase/inositol monophosphatase family enzyme
MQTCNGFICSQGLGHCARGGCAAARVFSAGVETEYKGDVDLVTVADRTVEKLIRTRLAEAFPEHGVYGEEGTRERMEGEFRWYVDPLDGTTNFAHGFPQFCVSLGLEHRPEAPALKKTERLWPGSSTTPCATSFTLPSAGAAQC